MKQGIILLVLLFYSLFLQAQDYKAANPQFLKIAISNSHSAKPFGSFFPLFYKDFHPGIDCRLERVIGNRRMHQWFLEPGVSYMFHRWVQHNIALYANAGYRHDIYSLWSAQIQMGVGYQLSIPNSKVYTVTESEGNQQKKNYGRSQLIAQLSLAVNRRISARSATRLYVEYKQLIQTPFIKEYVPVLPYNVLLIGVAIPFKHSSPK